MNIFTLVLFVAVTCSACGMSPVSASALPQQKAVVASPVAAPVEPPAPVAVSDAPVVAAPVAPPHQEPFQTPSVIDGPCGSVACAPGTPLAAVPLVPVLDGACGAVACAPVQEITLPVSPVAPIFGGIGPCGDVPCAAPMYP